MANIRLQINNKENYLNDVEEIPRAFFPFIKIDAESDDVLIMEHQYKDGIFSAEIRLNDKVDIGKMAIKNSNLTEYKKITKRFLKNRLYLFLKDITGVELPYGSLTGVRPTKMYYDSLGIEKDIKRMLNEKYYVSAKRANLIEQVVFNQNGLYIKDEKRTDIFLNIPFCPTRCKYCSFISTEYFRVAKKIPFYIDKMLEETRMAIKKIAEENLKVGAIYVGGGTPSVLEAEDLDRLLKQFKNFKVEFTVEAGRPDTLTAEKLQVMANNNVTRISINPQTASDKTLELIGRKHTFLEVAEKYKLAKTYGFDVNMDLIFGLEGETLIDIKNTLKEVLELEPDNITVHTLSIKRGAELALSEYIKKVNGEIVAMTDYAYKLLIEYGYNPYYMYRQKNTADNLENVGFAKKGKQCQYNIDIMEETTSIIGIGAGAMSKKVFYGNNKIERQCNPKDINLYLERELLKK